MAFCSFSLSLSLWRWYKMYWETELQSTKLSSTPTGMFFFRWTVLTINDSWMTREKKDTSKEFVLIHLISYKSLECIFIESWECTVWRKNKKFSSFLKDTSDFTVVIATQTQLGLESVDSCLAFLLQFCWLWCFCNVVKETDCLKGVHVSKWQNESQKRKGVINERKREAFAVWHLTDKLQCIKELKGLQCKSRQTRLERP